MRRIRRVVGLSLCLLLLVLPASAACPPDQVGARHFLAGGTEWWTDQFVYRYHLPGVREEVITRLWEMRHAGAHHVWTSLWLVIPEAQRDPATYTSFPLSRQEQANLKGYARDVRAVGLTLTVQLSWLWCADYQTMNGDGTIGACHYTWSEFLTRARTAINQVIQATKGHASILVLEGELLVASPRFNTDRFLRDLWPYFYERVRRAGMAPGLYYVITPSEAEIFDDAFTDADFPQLNGRRSLYWVVRATEFLRTEGLPLPWQFALSFYPNPSTRPVAELVERVMADIQHVYPGTMPTVAETYQDAETAQAFRGALSRRGWPVRLTFWPLSRSGPVSPPYDFTPWCDG